MQNKVEIQGIFISSGHRFYHHPAGAPGTSEMQSLETVECVAGMGLDGDRFFGHKDNYKGQVTFFSREVLDAVRRHVGEPECPPWATRRNILISGVDLNELIDRSFSIGEVAFAGMEECSPCHWMDYAIGEGAKAFLAGQGGLRARIVRSGTLSAGPAELSTLASA